MSKETRPAYTKPDVTTKSQTTAHIKDTLDKLPSGGTQTQSPTGGAASSGSGQSSQQPKK